MIIKDFYIFIWYAIWFYVVISVLAKLYFDNVKKKKLKKECDFIRKFFRDNLRNHQKSDLESILKMAENDHLFIYICEFYLQTLEFMQESEQNKFERYMARIINNKVRKLDRDDVRMRCLILSYINNLQIDSPYIDQFVNECKDGTNLEKVWVEEISSRRVLS